MLFSKNSSKLKNEVKYKQILEEYFNILRSKPHVNCSWPSHFEYFPSTEKPYSYAFLYIFKRKVIHNRLQDHHILKHTCLNMWFCQHAYDLDGILNTILSLLQLQTKDIFHSFINPICPGYFCLIMLRGICPPPLPPFPLA